MSGPEDTSHCGNSQDCSSKASDEMDSTDEQADVEWLPSAEANVPEFSIEEELIYARRLEECYDVYDEKYVHWLKIRHPDANIPSLVTQFSTDSSPSVSAGSSTSLNSPNTSIPLKKAIPTPSSSSVVLTTPMGSNTPHSPKSNSPPTVTTPLSRPGVPCSKRSPFSDLLTLPVVAAKKSLPKTGKSRVLTSHECLTLLKQRQDKKKMEAMKKGKRQQERLEKKKKREELQKQKVEERAQKAAKREAEKTQKAALKETARMQKLSSNAKNVPGPSSVGEPSTEPSNINGKSRSSRKRKRNETAVDDTILSDTCCVCFGLFCDDHGTGREWLQCTCGRWIHDDCVVIGSEKLCPFC